MSKDKQDAQTENDPVRNKLREDPRYAHHTLEHAVYLLAIGRGNIKERLIEAYTHLMPIRSADFPPELGEDYEWIVHSLTKNKTRYNLEVRDGELVKVPTGTLVATLRHMRYAKAVDIAKRICELDYWLREFLEISEQGTQE